MNTLKGVQHLYVRDEFPPHDLLELLRANLAGRVAQLAVARHVHEVRLGHVDSVVLRAGFSLERRSFLFTQQNLQPQSTTSYVGAETLSFAFKAQYAVSGH